MAALTACKIANGVFQLPILNEVEVDGEADVEALVDLTAEILGHTFNKHLLAKAQNVLLHIVASGKVGAPDFDITGIAARYDGANFHTLETFSTAITIDDNGAEAVQQISTPLGPADALKLLATVRDLDAAKKITLKAWLTFYAPTPAR